MAMRKSGRTWLLYRRASSLAGWLRLAKMSFFRTPSNGQCLAPLPMSYPWQTNSPCSSGCSLTICFLLLYSSVPFLGSPIVSRPALSSNASISSSPSSSSRASGSESSSPSLPSRSRIRRPTWSPSLWPCGASQSPAPYYFFGFFC